MKVISVNVGLPVEIPIGERLVATGIFKEPVTGPVRVRTLNLDGDRQADLTVHGGVDKAVYMYPSEQYPFWERELGGELSWGAFGENLTTEGLLETDVGIGDRMQIGSAEFLVTQPRQPCFKLGIRFGRDDMIHRFLASGRSGFYVRVVREGAIAAGDAIRCVARAAGSMTVSEIFALYFDDEGRNDDLRRAAAAPGLSPSWKDHFLRRLDALRS